VVGDQVLELSVLVVRLSAGVSSKVGTDLAVGDGSGCLPSTERM
jgi:hypothetical protein